MNQDSYFQQAFWTTIPHFYRATFLPEDHQIYTLQKAQKTLTLALQDGQLILLKDGQATKSLNLLEVLLKLDENGITLENRFGTLNLKGNDLKRLHEQIHSLCMHNDFQDRYHIQPKQYELPDFQVLTCTSRLSGMTYSARRFPKTHSKDQLRMQIAILRPWIHELYEDDDYVFIIVPYLSGDTLEAADLSFEQFSFGMLKLLNRYQRHSLEVAELSAKNVIVLDQNLNMELLDVSAVTQADFLKEENERADILALGALLKERYPQRNLAKFHQTPRPSAQELLFDETYVTHFGESKFYKLLNAKPYESDKKISESQLETFLQNQQTQIETFNTIRNSMMDSSDESVDDDLPNPYRDWMGKVRQIKQCTQSFEDSPMLSPVVQQQQQGSLQPARHKSKLSSRQVVLETLLNENIINYQQYQQFYKEEDFEDYEEVNQFSLMLQKEIVGSSILTTPIQSEHTTCPNTVKINSNKDAIMRVSDLLQEVQQGLQSQKTLQQDQKPYNVNKVQNVRKHLFNLH